MRATGEGYMRGLREKATGEGYGSGLRVMSSKTDNHHSEYYT